MVNLPLTAFTSLDLRIFTGQEPFCLSLALPYLTLYLLTIIEADGLVPQGAADPQF